jgi:hypothetical protein
MIHLSYGKILSFYLCPSRYRYVEEHQEQDISHFTSRQHIFSYFVEEFYRNKVRSNQVVSVDAQDEIKAAISVLQNTAVPVEKIDTVALNFSVRIPQMDVVLNGKFDIIELDKKNNSVKTIKYTIGDKVEMDPLWQTICSFALAQTYPLCDAYYLEKVFLPANKTLKIAFVDKVQALAHLNKILQPIIFAYKNNHFDPTCNPFCSNCSIGCSLKN